MQMIEVTPAVARIFDETRVNIAAQTERICGQANALPNEIENYEELNQADSQLLLALNNALEVFAGANALQTQIAERVLLAQMRPPSERGARLLFEQTRKVARLGATLEAFGDFLAGRIKAYNQGVDRFLDKENRRVFDAC